MDNGLLALIGGIASGLGQARERRTQEDYKKSLIDHIKTQAKLDQQKIELMGQQGMLEQQKFGMFQNLLSGGGVNPEQMVPKKPFPGQPGIITEIPPPSVGAEPPRQGLIPKIMGLLSGKQAGLNQGPQAALQAPSELQPLIQQTAQTEGLPPNLITAVIKAESQFNPQAVSPKGAQGLMQLMPATAQGLGVQNPMDPAQNIAGGTRFLKSMLQKYNGDLPTALAAYNWGPGNVDKYGLANMPAETKNYVATVLGGMQGGANAPMGGMIAPISGKVTSGFNASRGDRQHYGIDISSTPNTPFVAPANLQVTAVRDQMSNSPGGMVWGVDQKGVEHRFHHVQPGVKVGDVIQQGQPLGTIANINGPHLDYKQFDTKTGQFVDFTQPQTQQVAQQGQPQTMGGPVTGQGGKPLLSERDKMSLALQYLGGVKLPDGKTPLKFDLGDRIEVRDPENPDKIFTTIPKTPDTMTVTREDNAGKKWNEYYTQPRPGQPSQFLGKIDISPNAYQQGMIEGTKDLTKGMVAGEAPETAGKINLVRNALDRVQEAKSILFKDGKIDRAMLAKGFATGPGGAGIGDARTFYSKMYQTLDAALRLETGAQATPGEIQTKMNEFYPSPLDDDKTINSKIKDLESYINGLPGLMKGKQAFSGGKKQTKEQGQTVPPKTADEYLKLRGLK